MAGEVNPIVRLLQQVTENPAALRELMPSVGESAAKIPLEELSQPEATDLMTRVRGRLAEWLGSRAEGQPGPFSKPAASMLRAQGPTAPPPASPAMSPSPSPAMSTMKKLQAYAPYGRSYGEETQGVQFPETEFKTTGEAEPTPEATLGDPLRAMRMRRAAEAGAAGPPTMSQGPSMTSPAEMLRRPAGLERQELIGRVRDLLQSYKGGSEEALPELQRIKPSLQPQAPELPPEVKAGLSRMGAMPSEPDPTAPVDFPVTRQPYRGAPRQGTMNEPAFERFKQEGLKTSKLPQDLQDMVDQMVQSGQLPPEIAGSENAMRSVLARVYGYKPRALVGGQKTVGEAAPSRVGLMLQQFSNLSPEEITNVLGSIRPSGIMREGQRAVRAEGAAPLYQALGESRDPKDIVADLLRGGPSPNLQGGEFARNVLYPIMRKRQAAGLSTGQPLTLEQVISALKGSRFLRSDQPNPAREALLEKVAEMMKKRGGK